MSKQQIKQQWLALVLTSLLATEVWATEALIEASIEVSIAVDVPMNEGTMKYRPYVAVWIESAQGKTIKTLSVWRKEADWLKDMRRWWRKAGRYDQGELDAVTGATRRPGVHRVKWDGTDQAGQTVEPGKYFVNIEAAREHGSRSWVRSAVVLGEGLKPAVYTTKATEELGSITINVR